MGQTRRIFDLFGLSIIHIKGGFQPRFMLNFDFTVVVKLLAPPRTRRGPIFFAPALEFLKGRGKIFLCVVRGVDQVT